ncbi:hypothetical protein LptCag_1074 [Leptospirillum ferriphilum]|uniref:Uncharacterized protein n=1 Tax=Leptospirillum ferriphilum TaxID=178606 RepID=A0A094YM41_9BACT|nr:hypothetical protein LptCag_1074 [Leptospirillum ferriphilum]
MADQEPKRTSPEPLTPCPFLEPVGLQGENESFHSVKTKSSGLSKVNGD